MRNKEENFHGQDHFYLGNKNLPRPHSEFDWTPEMVANLKKCKKNILHFAENFFFIVNLDRGRGRIKLYKSQKKVLRGLRDNRFCILMASRQVGKTTLMTIYALWIACFNDDQRLLVVANKEQTAINIFKRIRLAYEELPNFLKPGVVEYGKTSLTLSNGSSIGISTTSSDAGRGESCNVLILDELAFIPENLIDQFWKSVFPIISSSKQSKIFIASTPNGTDNLFHKIYSDAIKKKSNWHAQRIDWWEVPGRDDKWKEDTIKDLGSLDAFNQEFGCQFLQAGESVLDEGVIERLRSDCLDPKYIFDDGHYLMWEEANPEKTYVAGVDIAEGVGICASVIQILDITDLTDIKQVAIYHNNTINPFLFTDKLNDILNHWGSPPALIERNNCGAQVIDGLYLDHHYPNIVSYSHLSKSKKFVQNRVGVIAHTNSKYKGVMNMRYWINELATVKLRDVNTVTELQNFVRYPNGTWSAKNKGDGYFDDRVMSLVWCLMILENTVAERYFDILEYDKYQRPLVMRAIDNIPRKFIDPTSLYSNEKYTHKSEMPVIFSDLNNSTPRDQDLEDLMTNGWLPYE